MKKRPEWITVTVWVSAALLVVFGLWWLRVPMFGLIPTRPIVVTDKDQGRVITMVPGQRIEVRLPGNALAHRTWHVGRPLPFLPQTGTVTFTPALLVEHQGDGYQSTTFTATGKGSGPLLLGYLADNNQNSYQPSRSFSVVVVVH